MEEHILIHNAKIYCSGKEDFAWMLFNESSGLITKLGRTEPPLASTPPENSLDVGGRRVLPGLQDAHMHLCSYAERLDCLDLLDSASIAELKQRVRSYCQDNPDKEWLVGYRWEQDKLGRYPTRDDLDLVCPDRPVVIRRICLHIAVVNTAALKLIGIDRNTEVRVGSEIDRYPDGHPQAGEPNGILREANFFFSPFVTPNKEEKSRLLKPALSQCLSNGITSIHALEEDTWDVFCSLVDSNKLPIRIFYVPYYTDRHGDNFPRAEESHGPMLSCDRIKLFTDGALGACTAALSAPYKDTKDNKGLLRYTQENLTELVADATARGYRLEIHAIGDAGADAMVTALEVAQVAPEKRPIMVHCQVLRADLIKRMKAQGVIGSLQPQFVLTDARWLDNLLPDVLQPCLYPWKTLLDSGNSDAPIEMPEPLIGIYDAIFRPADTRGKGNKTCFRPEEKLSVTEAIDLYTKGGAYATMREHCLGQLLPGYQADFIVLDAERDVCEHPEEFCQAKVAQVWVAGKQKL